MKRLNLIEYFELGGALRVLEPMLDKTAKKGEILLPLIRAEENLSDFIKTESSMQTCIESAKTLLDDIRELLSSHFYERTDTGMTFRADLDLEKEVTQWESHGAKKKPRGFLPCFRR